MHVRAFTYVLSQSKGTRGHKGGLYLPLMRIWHGHTTSTMRVNTGHNLLRAVHAIHAKRYIAVSSNVY